MKIYENGENWVIEDQLDLNFVNELIFLIDNNLENFIKNKDNKSTTGNAEQYWLKKGHGDIHIKNNRDKNYFLYNDHKFKFLITEYRKNIVDRLKKSEVLKNSVLGAFDLEFASCWTVIGEENSFHIPHFHNDGNYNQIVTVLYLKVPETNNIKNIENNLFLILNSGMNNILYNNRPKLIDINPEVGKLLIFPSWIIHGTCPQTKGTRQTFNLDFTFFNKEYNKNKINYT